MKRVSETNVVISIDDLIGLFRALRAYVADAEATRMFFGLPNVRIALSKAGLLKSFDAMTLESAATAHLRDLHLCDERIAELEKLKRGEPWHGESWKRERPDPPPARQLEE